MSDLDTLKKELDEQIGDSVVQEAACRKAKQEKDAAVQKQASEKWQGKMVSELEDIAKIIVKKKTPLPAVYPVEVTNPTPATKEVKVSNLKDIKFPEIPKPEKFPEEISTKEPSWLMKYMLPVVEAIRKQAEKVLRVKVIDTEDPKKPVAVRLSDGNRFYNAISAVATAVGKSIPFINKNTGFAQEPVVDDDGNLQIDVVATTDTDTKWGTNHIDDYTTADTTYIGKEKADGTWWIIKIDETGNFPVFTHASVTNNPTLTTYSTAWAARTTATYNIYESAF